MLFWILALIVMLVIWARLWQTNPKMAFGILLGLPIAWLFSRMTEPYFTGVQQVPVWLPPLPFAIVAITLFVFGALVWIRGTRQENASGRNTAQSMTRNPGDDAGH